MAKKKIKDIAAEMLTDFLAENGLELFNIEYVKEGKQRFLRVYIDKPPAEDGTDQYIDIEECEKVSRYLSDRLDEADPVEENYTLEVSSPGLDRPLIRESDYVRYAGRLVDVKLYKALNGRKEFSAELEGLEDGTVCLKDGDEELRIPLDSISKIRLAVVF
ncbi:MAG: ribosome maturation factor RimP [Anaerovoracaceae bacterium]|nr:ribosome maturation factor RimP [Bacillota bacterium]MDY2671372.1 ribosome maturation factor RimP [Anaerovoracaceae bacterium]